MGTLFFFLEIQIISFEDNEIQPSTLSKPGCSIFGMLMTNQITISMHFKPQCKYGTSFDDVNT